MAIKRIIILSILFTQSLSLPSGCIESCTTYRQVSSYRTHQESNNHNDHTDSNIRNVNHLNLNYDRPGNWTEQNEYRVDNGHGKVYEEQGQYVQGPKSVRYFKKNYTSSYSNTHPSNLDLLQPERLINQNRYNSLDTINNQRIYEESRNSESYRQEHNYNKLHNDQLQESYRERGGNIGRLENFGESSDRLQMSQHGTSAGNSELLQGRNQYTGIRNDNWTRVNTYKTDEGNGRVLEEEGQYVIGPKITRYYQQNYTSQYSTSLNPTHKITSNINDLHNTMQKVNQEFQNLERKIHQSSRLKHVTSSNTLHMDTMNSVQDNVNPTFRNHDLQVAESADYRHRDQNEHVPTNGNIYNVHQNQLLNRQTYTGEDTLYRNENNMYNRNRPGIQHQRQEAYISQSHTNVLPSNIQTSNSENTNYQRYRENEQIGLQRNINENYQREYLDTHQSQITQNYRSRDNLQHRTLNENVENHPHIKDQILQYHWDSTGQTREIVDTNPNERNQYYSHHKSSTYNKEVGHTLDNNYNPGYTGNLQQLITGTQGLNHGMQDCIYETEQRYIRKHKRNANNNRHNSILNNQDKERILKNIKDNENEKLTYNNREIRSLRQPNKDLRKNNKDMMQQTWTNKRIKRHNQHLEDIAQNYEDMTQQTDDLTQQSGGFDDLTQQTSGNIEFGQINQKPNSHNQHFEDLTQQTDDLTQQLGGFDDLTQQTSGHIEFSQQNQKPSNHGQRLEDLTQQTDDLTQQTSGHIEFGQPNQKPSNHNQRLEDLTQQTSGHIEFSQQNQKPRNHNQRFEDLTQQTDDSTQQTSGHIEFGQPNHYQRFRDLPRQIDDLILQISGNIESGQPNQNPRNHNQRLEDLIKQSDDLTQLLGGFDDLTQQISGHSVNGQQRQQFDYPKYPFRHNQQFTNEEHLYTSMSSTEKQSDINENKPLHLLTPAPKPKWKLRYKLSNQVLTDSTDNPSSIHVHHSSDITDQTIPYQNQLSGGSSPHQEVGTNNDFYSMNHQSSNQQDPIQLNTQNVIKNGSPQSNSFNRNGFTKGGHRSTHIYQPSNQSQYSISNSVSQSQLNKDLNLEEVYRKKENQNNNQENLPSQESNPEKKIEPRILEAYGGGPYDADHNDDIFNHVTLNPDVTLPPHLDGKDPWDIREKPKEVIPLSTTMITPEITEKVETEVPPTFWTRLGHRFTTTFDKAKEKAKDLFG